MLTEPRVICATCRRPEVVCYCRFVTKLSTRTRIVILQHPRERDVPINTARIASLCLPDSNLETGVRWSGTPALARALGDPARPPVLLYPGPGAIDIEKAPPPGPVTLVVLDGTWWQARKLVRSNAELAALPRYAFRPPAPSDYRIRKEPHEDCVSTLEALAHVLGVLESDRERFEAMLIPFRAMVDMQLEYASRGLGRPRIRRPSRRVPSDPRTRLPAALRERAGDVVCVHAEANAWPYSARARAGLRAGSTPALSPSAPIPEDELVHWVAHRLATGESFEMFLAPRGEIAPRTPDHLRVDREVIANGKTREEFLAAWSRFVRPDDVTCMWGTYTANIFKRTGGSFVGPSVDVRRAARVYMVERVGTMESFLPKLDLEAPASSLGAGRAGLRLAQLASIVRAFAG